MSQNIESYIAANFTFAAGTVDAAKEFANSKPFRGTIEERREKYLAFHANLCEIHSLDVVLRFVGDNDASIHSGASCAGTNRDNQLEIALLGRLSVVTYLTLFAGFLTNRNMEKAKRWAFNLFSRSFPRSFAKLRINEFGYAEQRNDA